MADWIKIIIVAAAMVVGIGIRFVWKGLKDDNPVEEMAEDIIKNHTGWDLDLTPSTPEKK